MESAPHYITQLLIVSDDSRAANCMISDLRRAGMALRCAQASHAAQLSELLSQEPWDVLMHVDGEVVQREALLHLLEQHQQELLVVLVTEHTAALPPWGSNVYDIVQAGDAVNIHRSLQHAAHYAALRQRARQVEIQCKELVNRNDQLLVHSTTPICTLQQGIHVYCNPAYAELFGFEDSAALIGKPFVNLVSADDQVRLQQWMAQPDSALENIEAHMHCFDDAEKPMLLVPAVVEHQGKRSLQLFLQHAAGNTKYRAALEKIQYRDLLTQLYNRSYFMIQVETAIRRAVDEGKFSAMLLLQLTDFGKWCEALGRQNANMLLHDVALQLSDLARAPILVSRIEESAFGLLLPHGKPDAVLQFAVDLQQTIADRVLHENTSMPAVTFTTGIALINGYALQAEEILKRAQSQPLPANTLADKYQFQIGDSAYPSAEATLEYLALALAERRFVLKYQPIVGLQASSRKGYEVLVRMYDPDGNEIAPSAFLPLAIINGMGESLDRVVTSMLLESQRESDSADQLMLNLTSATLDSGTFLPWLRDQLTLHRFAAQRLVLDISEVDLHRNQAHVLNFCRGAQELGLQLALSHFGCALQPLALLEKLQPALVILDVSLVRNILYSPRLKKHVHKLIASLHEHNLKVVTPQIEDVDVLPLLWGMGADYAQGYCLQPPSPSMDYAFMQEEEITLPSDRH